MVRTAICFLLTYNVPTRTLYCIFASVLTLVAMCTGDLIVFFPGQCEIERQQGHEKATAILGRHDSAIGAEYHHGYYRILYKK